MGPPGRQTHAPRARDFGWDHRYIAGLLLFRARECVCGVVEQLGNVSKFGGALQRFFSLLVGCMCGTHVFEEQYYEK